MAETPKLVESAPVFDGETERRIARAFLAETDEEIDAAWSALRSRIRELVEEARKDDARRTDDFLRALEGELSYEGWEIVKGYLVTEAANG